MDVQTFERELEQQGFSAPLPGHYAPGQFNDTHAHGFEVRGLVTAGEMTITPQGAPARRYGPGDVFVMALDMPHQERVGPEGCSYIWGRTPPA